MWSACKTLLFLKSVSKFCNSTNHKAEKTDSHLETYKSLILIRKAYPYQAPPLYFVSI